MRNFALSHEFDLNDLTLVLSLSATGSMSATARALTLDVSTVSRRIASAEKSLGVRLFVRTTTRYELTEAGKQFVERAEQICHQINAMFMACTSEVARISGSVRITSIDFLLDYWLVQHLPALKSKYVDLEIQLIASDSNLSFTRREADLALRLGKPKEDAALLMRKFGKLGFSVFGAPSFANTSRSNWADQPWITYDDSLANTPEMKWIEHLDPARRKRLCVGGLGTMVSACRAGNGLALLPSLLGTQAELVSLSVTPEVTREIWLLSHRDATSVARFRVVSEWLNEVYDASRLRLSGLTSSRSLGQGRHAQLGGGLKSSQQDGDVSPSSTP